MKDIKVSQATHQRLFDVKMNMDLNSMDATINYLLDFHGNS